jgi:hypothetical protein
MAKGRNSNWSLRPRAPIPYVLLESHAWIAISAPARQVFLRLVIEYGKHRGGENGALPCTFKDFEDYGIGGNQIARSIRELVAVGLIEVARALPETPITEGPRSTVLRALPRRGTEAKTVPTTTNGSRAPRRPRHWSRRRAITSALGTLPTDTSPCPQKNRNPPSNRGAKSRISRPPIGGHRPRPPIGGHYLYFGPSRDLWVDDGDRFSRRYRASAARRVSNDRAKDGA